MGFYEAIYLLNRAYIESEDKADLLYNHMVNELPTYVLEKVAKWAAEQFGWEIEGIE